MEKFNRISILIAIISYFFVATSCNQNKPSEKIEDQIIGHWVLLKYEGEFYDFISPPLEIFYYKDKTMVLVDETWKWKGSYNFFTRFDIKHIGQKLITNEIALWKTYMDETIQIQDDTLIFENGADNSYKFKFWLTRAKD